MNHIYSLGASLLVFSSLLLLAGCGSDTVTGKVTLDSEPVAKGSILFVRADASGAKISAGIQDGKFELRGKAVPKPGQYKVEIRWPKPTGKMIPVVDDPPNTIEEVKEAIPAKYNTSTELTVDVTPGTFTRDFALTTK